MHAMRDRQRKHLHHGRKGCHDRLINKKILPLSGGGEWNTDKLVVVGKYTKTRQMWLKGKIVKYGHSRHYKNTLTVPRKWDRKKTREEHKNRIERK